MSKDDTKAIVEDITLKIQDQNGGNLIHFKMKKSTPFKKMMNAYCTRQKVTMESLSFTFEDNPLLLTDCPNNLQMKDGDTIEATEKSVEKCKNLAIYDIPHDDWLEKLLECPVCFNVPRDLPIPQCPAGHIVCKKCKSSLTNCPTCRRRMYHDGTSSLAATLIEKVPHKCKFAEYGCDVKDLLCQLKNHEEKCEERTIKCLYKGCCEEVQLKKYKEHVLKKCSVDPKTPNMVLPLSEGFMKWDGVSKNRGKEFDLDVEGNWLLVFSSIDDVFRVIRYVPTLRSLVFALFTTNGPEEVSKVSAKITMCKGELKTSFECPIIPIEQFPSDEDFPNDENCWNVHYSLFKKFLLFEDKGENNNHNWEVTLHFQVDIIQKKEK